MAESMVRRIGGGRFEACSAGLSPTGAVSQLTLAALETLGYQTGGLRSKGLDAIDLSEMDAIVSLIGDDGLRWLPKHLPATRYSWQIRDPYGEDEETFLEVGRVLEERITRLIQELESGELR
jgi:arsenate reductase